MNLEFPIWVIIVSFMLIIFCFAYTLTFIEYLHKGELREAKQSKVAAIICLGLAFLIPFVYSLIANDF